MQITIDTNNLSDLDVAMLAFLANVEPTEEVEEAPKPTPKKTAAKKTAAKVEEPAEEPEEDLLGGDGPSMADAVALATKMVSDGQTAKVKEALAAVGAKRVSELEESSIADFLAVLEG